MRSEIEYSNGEPALVRLVGEPVGPAGTATAELGNDCMFVMDAAEPNKVVEVLLRSPVKDKTKKLVHLAMGDEAINAIDSEVQNFEVEPTPPLATIGRLSLLYLVRDAMQLPTHQGLWAIEAAQLAASIPTPLCQEHAIIALLGTENDPEYLQAHFPDAPRLGRLVRSIGNDMIDAEDLFTPLDELVDWFRHSDRTSSIDAQQAPRLVSNSGTVGWDRVPPGIVDPRENNIEVQTIRKIGNREGIRVRVLAQEGANQRNVVLFAHIFDASSGQKLQSIPLSLSGDNKEFRGTGIMAASAESFIVDISDGLDEPLDVSRYLAIKHRARRNAFRALFFERRATQGDVNLANRASLLWEEVAKDYELLGDKVLATKANERANSDTVGIKPFVAELSVPIDFI